MTNTKEKTLKMVQIAFLAALVVVLQLLSSFTATLGLPVNITLTLLPIVIGGMLLGPAQGAALGFVFGAIVFVTCAVGMDIGGSMLFQANPFLCGIICFVKGTAAGFVPAFIFAKTKSYRADNEKRLMKISMLVAAISPIVNTGLFILAMPLFFKDILYAWAGETNVVYYAIFGLTGINFAIEFFINLILAPQLVKYLKNTKYFKSVV